jgi:hypothetical protein
MRYTRDMRDHADWFRKTIASGKLKITTALLSALGVTAFNSCGLYFPIIAMYMPAPTYTVTGTVRSSAGAKAPIPAIDMVAADADDPENTLGIGITADDGSYSLGFYSLDGDVAVRARDADGETNGEFADRSVVVDSDAIRSDPDGIIQVDIELDPKAE